MKVFLWGCPDKEVIISSTAKALRLPCLTLTEVADSPATNTLKVSLKHANLDTSYFTRPCYDVAVNRRVDGKPVWMGTQFNLFPVVLDSNGVPWAEAVVYLLSRLENSIEPNMETYRCIADDLAAYLRFIEDSSIVWTEFPLSKLLRPTYRYRASLMLDIASGTLSSSTAKRRMGAVVGFYRWLISESVLKPECQPWTESDRFITFSDSRGLSVGKKVATTDLKILTPKSNDPYGEHIEDGGKLRPLELAEQEVVLQSLGEYGNTELTLIHLIALFTGARLQTVLTLKVMTVNEVMLSHDGLDVRIPVGLGTGVDTKKGKPHVLHMPKWLWERLVIYANSVRAIKRRERANGGDYRGQYLFLSVRGAPFYESRSEALIYDEEKNLRHTKTGQAVRQLISQYIIPRIRKRLSGSFSYRFHDLRATYGMNLTDQQLVRVQRGEISLHEAREFVKTRMGHESSQTTDLYLNYRGRIKFHRAVNDAYGEHLRGLITGVFGF
ncbi:site-specific integrase [Pseudomonas chlororaphis]|uniref:site-specific integrase n=1 Tax=Pseudomonas chlororaphis TaxID=587753 RepID=UPI002366375C|nr:site-specific integrase [Pseudomonas chlororaphis]WDH22461.1 hypothetical protein PUP50_31630 [Pseudomonas chlororaphis]